MGITPLNEVWDQVDETWKQIDNGDDKGGRDSMTMDDGHILYISLSNGISELKDRECGFEFIGRGEYLVGV